MIKKGFFRLQRLQGESIQVANTMVTPFSRRLSLGLPEWLTASKGFAFIYQQPASVRIEEDGQVSEIPIHDYQNTIIASMLLIAAVFVFIAHCSGRKEKNQ
jgi:hypothetical protein